MMPAWLSTLVPRSTTRWRTLCWTGEHTSLGWLFAAGALIWAGSSILIVAFRGIILDQSVVAAQIISGAVAYPAGHPHQVFYSQAFSFLNYLAAAIWRVLPTPEPISFCRNVLSLFLALYGPFTLATVLTRRPMWGHVASVLTLSEAVVTFQGNYPIAVFPAVYSDGQIGQHLAVVLVAILLARLWRPGAFLLAILPAIHLAMAIVVWPWAALYVLVALRQDRVRELRRAVVPFAFGAALCLITAVAVHIHRIAPVSPYQLAGLDGPAIYKTFTRYADVHRQLPPVRTVAYLVNPVAFFACCWLLAIVRKGKQPSDEPVFWLCLAGVAAWTYVYASWITQFVTGTLPPAVLLSMPARFSNITAIMLLPAAVALFGRSCDSARESLQSFTPFLVCGILSFELVMLRWNRQQLSYYLMFVILGLAAGTVLTSLNSRRVPVALITAAVLVTIVSVRLTFAIAFAVAAIGVFLFFGVLKYATVPAFSQSAQKALHIGVALLCASVTVTAAQGMTLWDIIDRAEGVFTYAGRMTPFDRELKTWLCAHAASSDMILAPTTRSTQLQMKTGHPVLMEIETVQLMSYLPSLAPAIGMMANDLFGIDYMDTDRIRTLRRRGLFLPIGPEWYSAWKERTAAEWHQLSMKYDFCFVLAPAEVRLDLPPVLSDSVWRLYDVRCKRSIDLGRSVEGFSKRQSESRRGSPDSRRAPPSEN